MPQSEVRKLGKKYRIMNDKAKELFMEFKRDFKLEDYTRPKPFFIPKFMWNLLLNWLFKRKKYGK